MGASQGVATVTFNGTTATASVWTATSLTVTVPVGTTTGSVIVSRGDLVSNSLTFTVTTGGVVNPINASRLPCGSATVPNPCWEMAGVRGGIPTNRTRCGSVVAAYTGTATTINNAITACPAGQYVELGAGKFTLSTTILMTKSNVTLRGQGSGTNLATDTWIVSSGATQSCGFGFIGWAIQACTGGNIGIGAAGGFPPPSHTATWSSGYTAGTTSIVVSSTTGLRVGSTIHLDQLNQSTDGYPAAGDVWICETESGCSADGSSSDQRSGRVLDEMHEVMACGTAVAGAACTSTTLTIEPPIITPMFRSGQTPGAWWGNVNAADGTLDVLTGVGLENFLLEFTASSNIAAVGWINQSNSWIKGVAFVRQGPTASFTMHVFVLNGFRNTFEQNYFYGAEEFPSNPGGNTTNYAMSMYSGTSQLVVNNIFHATTEPIEMAAAEIGTVFAYNFETASWFSSAGIQNHGFAMMTLSEGNNWGVRLCDNNHGPAYFETMFRDQYQQNRANGATSAGAALLTHCRFFNIVGNVFSNTATPAPLWTVYQSTNCTDHTPNTSTCGNTSIYALGWGNNCTNCAPAAFNLDTNVNRTVMRWGNYDNVNAAVRFVNAEVPSGIANFPNTVPASQTLPTSLVYASKPAFLGSRPWPGNGPDVTGGNITGTGAHANWNAAGTCFNASGVDSAYSAATSPQVRSNIGSKCAVP